MWPKGHEMGSFETYFEPGEAKNDEKRPPGH